jgi:formate hydrogenlyase subunit 4
MPSDSIAGAVSELAGDTARLVQLEIELAQQELKALLWRNIIVEAVPIRHWISALILAVVFIIVAVVLALVGRSRLKFAPPEATIQTIKDDLEWVKQQIRPETR